MVNPISAAILNELTRSNCFSPVSTYQLPTPGELTSPVTFSSYQPIPNNGQAAAAAVSAAAAAPTANWSNYQPSSVLSSSCQPTSWLPVDQSVSKPSTNSLVFDQAMSTGYQLPSAMSNSPPPMEFYSPAAVSLPANQQLQPNVDQSNRYLTRRQVDLETNLPAGDFQLTQLLREMIDRVANLFKRLLDLNSQSTIGEISETLWSGNGLTYLILLVVLLMLIRRLMVAFFSL